MLKTALPKAKESQNWFYVQIRDGNTKCSNINNGSKKTESFKACPEKETVWITLSSKISSEL